MSGRHEKTLWQLHLLFFVLILSTLLILVFEAALFFWHPSKIITGAAEVPSAVSSLGHVPPVELSAPEPIGAQTPELAADGRLNILLIGQDTREAGSRARSDAMLLCSFHKDSQKLTIISFLRDLYVQIPGYRSNRLNAAYAWGGMPLLKQTLSHNFGIRIDGCIEVDFQNFVQVVDLIGGITLTLRQDEAEVLNRLQGTEVLTEGAQHLNGQQALAYTRIRNLDPDGDFSRTLRQRKLLTALLEQLRQCSLWELLSLISPLRDLVSTDLTAPQIVSYAMGLLPLLSGTETEHLCIPADGTYAPETIDGMAVLVADLQQAKTILRAALEDE